MKKILIIAAGVLRLCLSVYAQDSVEVTEKLSRRDIARSKYKRAIMLVPQYATINGLRVDLEFRTKNNAIVFGPAFYVDNNANSFSFYGSYKSMIGAGLDIAYKINLVNPNKCFVPYGALNTGYSWKQIDTDIENINSTTGTYSYENTTIAINKIALDALIGFQITPSPRFVIDISGGVGGKYSFSDSHKDYVRGNFSDNMNSIAYTGIMPVCNVKLGIKI